MARSAAAAAAALLLFLLLVVLSIRPAAAAYPEITAFGRREYLGTLNLLGSAYIVHGREPTLALTSDGVGAGRALFPYPVRFLLPPRDARTSPALASFSTRFTVRITPSPTYGDGMAFLITSSPTFLGSAEGYMGIYAAGPAASHIDNITTVAVELDTRHDMALGDMDGNHVGIDTVSIFSVASATASPAVDLKAGRPVTAWVDYNGPRRRLRVWVSFSSSRAHLDPTLSLSLDLSNLVCEWMYVGFSAANTEGGAARHLVGSWSFKTLWDRNTRQRYAPPPPSPSSPLPTPPPPVPASPPRHHHHKLKIAFAVLVAFVAFVLLMGTLLLLLRRRRMKKVGGYVEMKKFLPKYIQRSS